jgi:UPF0755 protein
LSRSNRSRPANERTAEQRERDRLERERRRVGRGGGDDVGAAEPPSEPVGVRALDDDPAAAATAEGEALAPSEPAVPDPSVELGRPVAPESIAPVEPAPVETGDVADARPATEPGSLYDEYERAPDGREVEGAAVESTHDEPSADERPVWEVREDEAIAAPVAAAADMAALQATPAAAERRGRGDAGGRGSGGWGPGDRRGRARPGSGHGGRRLTRARVAALLALVAAAALVWFLISLFQPFAGAGSGKVIVSIPKGSSSSKIGSILAHDGVVSSGFFFDVRALFEGKRSSLHSGRFALKRDMSYSAAIEALSKPPPKAIAVKVVIPEGYTRRQIADLVSEDALTGDYLAQTKRSRVLDPSHYGAPANTPDLEGFLFPATYDLTAGAPVKRLVDDQLTAFRQRFTSADKRRAHALGVTAYELLTVASMIEREAQTDKDRPLIAAVIYNRLREGIPLGIDATIYYAVEQQMNIATYTGELTESQLKIDSPYNTRTHKGLPPTPISNPGEASIEAAAHPAHVHYLYYVAGADGCGEQAFSDTYAQFQKNVDAYDAAVKKNGGRPPKCKKK